LAKFLSSCTPIHDHCPNKQVGCRIILWLRRICITITGDDPEEEDQAFVLDKTTLASELVVSGEVYIKAIMNDNTSWTFGKEDAPVLLLYSMPLYN